MILRVGLTGGIASGKSTIARMFAKLGCTVVDADAIVARLYLRGNAGHDALVNAYGAAILREDGEIDRQKLADVAFASPEGSRRLNALIHPLVHAEQARMFAEAESGEDRVMMVEATLLLESGGRDRYDRIVVVDVEPGLQLERGVARGMPREEVARRMAHQMPREERLRHADYIIDNGGDLRRAEEETRRVYGALVADLAEKT
ncbi:MAG TPA: dephospho-CoA kinase [Thermoanaerobaculia bacterium]|nr:dephospho-CoA kinase [Thermoanaerobaculia bacterium]